mmetsp:Transcript_14044/g.30504  ORF Transcript_14044/g.30504 Transcript_14044/m.30504 type:complete len:153 (-) Transcript_14044:146-604(-)|eukprot:CAMPEP_0178498506 /NCGR_PEP_ID=MMETSP0696-20121128/15292_1 /TAXON_ID=265572 /ORGANISM="Extubocellulus spinifer, Strain CCMP396" /LENGTH=152 /DNA_ID=CAMNT_0020127071 /DNA_START=126 /DNA_END=584 /DNA_ORIENTATION=+
MNLSFSASALFLALVLALNGSAGVEAANNAVGISNEIGSSVGASAVPLMNEKGRMLSDSDEDEEEDSDEDSDEEEDSAEEEEDSAEEEAEEEEEEEMEMAYYAYGAAGSATVILSALGLMEWKRRVRVKTSAGAGLIDEGIRTNYVSAVEMA